MKLNNKRGVVEQIMSILIIIIVLVVIVVLFWAGSVTLPLLTGAGSDAINQISTTINTQAPNSDIANASNVATSIGTGVIGIMEYAVYFALIILIVGFMILAYYVRTYPFLSFFWVLIMIALTFLSMILSNAYTTASLQPATASYYSTWGSNGFIMENLPYIIVFVGFIGGIILFVLASREPESEVQQL